MSIQESLRDARVLAILRRDDIGSVVIDLFEQLYAAGIRAVEVTLDSADSLEALARLVAHAPTDTVVGAGTVTTTDHIDAVVELGGSFVVCPHLDVRLVEHAVRRELPILPGVATASEAAAAWQAGARVLKLFPAGPLGIPYLKALRGPFRQVPFVPTGGIGVEDVPAWLAAGALCVGVGGALIGPSGVDPRLGDVLSD